MGVMELIPITDPTKYEDASHYTMSCFAEKGEGYKPKLIVTYTPWNPVPVFANHYARMRRR